MSSPIPRPKGRPFAPRCARIAPALALLAFAASCNDGSDPEPPPLPTTSSVPAGATAALFTKLGTSFASGAGSGTASALTGWALGQLGLAGTDSTGAALQEIQSTLQDISGQLKDIAAEIAALVNITVVANCQQLSNSLTTDIGRINTVLQTYETIICTGSGTCANGAPPANVSEATLITFMDNALGTATGGQNGMDAILDRINQALVGATQGGIISACIHPNIPGLTPPASGTFNDAEYYTKVEPVSAYYYYYQTVAMLLYSEAQRYRAYQIAGAPDASQVDPEEVNSYLLNSTDPDVVFVMNQTANRMQATWNNLRNQFNLVGAPYTNEDLLLRNSATNPVLYALDLEEFTVAAGGTCSDLTTNNYGCTSPIQGPRNLSSDPIRDVLYAGQSDGWRFATLQELSWLMDGWSGGYAYEYLEKNDWQTTRGFKKMKNKVLIADATADATLTFTFTGFPTYNGDWNFTYVPFIDGAFHYTTPGLNGHLPVDSTAAIREQMVYSKSNTYFYVNIGTANRAPHDYIYCYGTYYYGTSQSTMAWQQRPGWLASSPDQRTRAFHLPVIEVNSITPNGNLRRLNAAGVPTMCTDDFEHWFEAAVPPPVFQ